MAELLNTQTEENYLKAIYKHSLSSPTGMTTNAIAEQMDTKASSVTNMLQKLAEKEMVNYRKYQGVTLTPEGKRRAIMVLRKHRLWEVFLYEHLEFSWDEVHDIAEELEHVSSNDLVERLDKFLGFPKSDPHGDLIPDRKGYFPINHSVKLSTMINSSKGTVSGVNDTSSAFLTFLDKVGIRPGVEIEIMEWHEFDHSAEVRINQEQVINLSYQATQNILVTKNRN
ncbi:MAG TPA: metal-dependent transcriptional regulator [Sunxiuqinia sp.]|nr:metal-dependent transcriptional regulator [Sunxiuqinia sp.]